MAGSLERIAARFMVRPRSPTADLYLVNACKDWIGPGRPITRLGPGVFASQRTLLVIRNAGRARRLPARERLVWLIDDDIEAARADPGLPLGQRLKLALLEARHGARLIAAGAEVVASSEVLAGRLRAASPAPSRVHLLRPHWSEPLAALDHHAERGPVRLAYLGSAAHRGDLDRLRPVLARLLARGDVELHLAANHALGELARHPSVVTLAETAWPAWRAALPSRRFHIALYPLADTAVNRARSINKIVEHAIAGAVALYSDSWPEAARVARRGAGLVLPDSAEAWATAAEALIDDPSRRLALAARARALAGDLNHPGTQRDFWRHVFALSPPDPTVARMGGGPSRLG